MEGCQCPPTRGERKGRNLVVCIDGTSNQYGKYNTNVVELYSKIIKDEDQITYYNSGIGTYARPSWKSVKYMLQVAENMVDLAIAWNFEKILVGAYRWLSDNFMENDRIYLFGFSRGAYQVRALAGMIETVGLIHRGNEEQIPFAFELYSRSADDPDSLAARFKSTFSRENVKIHFVGVWDTVSSVGVIRGKTLPRTHTASHICFFRHALALDERRVKFLPEYVHGGESIGDGITQPSGPANADGHDDISTTRPHIKEVWFPGTHSDIGGGNQLNPTLSLGRTPMLWMSFEAVSCGLRLRPGQKVEWAWEQLGDVRESMHGIWYLLEWMPMKRLTYKARDETTTRLHRGKGRKIKPGQRVHSSVAFCKPGYRPQAKFSFPFSQTTKKEEEGSEKVIQRNWKSLIGNVAAVTSEEWRDIVEMDIFDSSPAAIRHLIRGLDLQGSKDEPYDAREREDQRMWIYRLQVITSSDEGMNSLTSSPQSICELIEVYHSLQNDARHAESADQVLACIIDILEAMCKRKDRFFHQDEIQWLTDACLRPKDPTPRALDLTKWWISMGCSGYELDGLFLGGAFDEAVRSFLLSRLEREGTTNEACSILILGIEYGFLPEIFLSERNVLRLFVLLDHPQRQVQTSARNLLMEVKKWHSYSPKIVHHCVENASNPSPTVRMTMIGVLRKAIQDGCHANTPLLISTIESQIGDTDVNVKLEALKLLRFCCLQGHDQQIVLSLLMFERLMELAVGPEGQARTLAREIIEGASVFRYDLAPFKARLESVNSNIICKILDLIASLLTSNNVASVSESVFPLIWNILWTSGDNHVQNIAAKTLVAAMKSSARDLALDELRIAEVVGMLSSSNSRAQRASCQFLAVAVNEDKWAMFPISQVEAGLEACLCHAEWLIRLTSLSVIMAYLTNGQAISAKLQELVERCFVDVASSIQDAVIDLYQSVLPYEASASLFRSPSLPHKLSKPTTPHLKFFIAAVSQEHIYPELFTDETCSTLQECLSIQWMASLPIDFYRFCANHEHLFGVIVTTEVKAAIWSRYVAEQGVGDVSNFYTTLLEKPNLAPKFFDDQLVQGLIAIVDSHRVLAESLLAIMLAKYAYLSGTITRKIDAYFAERWTDGTGDITRDDTIRCYVSIALRQEEVPSHMFDERAISAVSRSSGPLGLSWIELHQKALHVAALKERLFTAETSRMLASKISDEHPATRDAAFAFYIDLIDLAPALHDALLDESALLAIYDHLLEKGKMPKRDLAVAFYASTLAADSRTWLRILNPSVIDGILDYKHEKPTRFQVYTTEQIQPLKFAIAAIQHGPSDLRKRIVKPEMVREWNKNLYADNVGEVKSLVVQLYAEAVRIGEISNVLNPGTMQALLDAIMPEHVNGRVISLAIHDPDSWHSNKHILEFLESLIAKDEFRSRLFTSESIDYLWPTLLRLGPDLPLSRELLRVLTTRDAIKSLIYDSLVRRALIEEPDETFRKGAGMFLAKVLRRSSLHCRLCTSKLREHFKCPLDCKGTPLDVSSLRSS